MSNDGSQGGMGAQWDNQNGASAYGQGEAYGQGSYDQNAYGQDAGWQGGQQSFGHEDATRATPVGAQAGGAYGGYSGGGYTPTAGQPMGGQPYSSPNVEQNSSPAGFFKALFDFSFSYFITPKVVKFVYVLSTVALGIAWLIFLIGAFNENAAAGLAVLILGPVVVILYLVFIRITLEFYLATVRMSEDIHHRLR